MREIKFRAWDGEQMIYPKGDLHITFFDSPTLVKWNVYDGDTRIVSSQYSETALMQFTGLKDKNGKEIFEGDICMAYQTLYTIPSPLIVKVIYNNDYGRFEPVQYWKGDSKWKSLIDGFKCDYTFEIIGNIYENPELLKP